jgi:hypothetical protein
MDRTHLDVLLTDGHAYTKTPKVKSGDNLTTRRHNNLKNTLTPKHNTLKHKQDTAPKIFLFDF